MSVLASGSEASYDDATSREDKDIGKCVDVSPEQFNPLTDFDH